MKRTFTPIRMLVAIGALFTAPAASAQLSLLDFTAPAVTIVTPSDGAPVTASVAVEAEASDGLLGTGVARVEARLDSGPWIALSSNLVSNTWRATVSAAGLSDGGHALFVRAADRAGNVRTVGVTVVVAQPPAVPAGVRVSAPTAPSDGGHLDVTWAENAEPDLSGYFVYRSNAFAGPYARVANVRTPSYRDLLIHDGTTYYYAVSAYDFSGNESGRSAPSSGVAFDTRSPDISGVAARVPAPDRAEIAWTTHEGASSQVLFGKTEGLGEATMEVAGERTSHLVVLEGLETNTTWYFQVRSADAAGNVSRSPIATFQTGVDLPPSVSIVEPADGAVIQGAATLRASATDDRGLARVEYTIGGFTWNELPFNGISGHYEASLDGLADGQYAIAVRGTDSAGQTAQQVISITVDRRAPVVELLTPELDAHLVSGLVHDVRARVTDGSISAVQWQVVFAPVGADLEAPLPPDEAAWAEMTADPQTGEWTAPWASPLVVVEQVVFVYVRATDGLGRVTTLNREVTVIPTGLEFSFIGTGGQELFGTVAIEPIGADGGNVMGIQVIGRELTPGGDYSVTVRGDGEVHSAAFRADGGGRGEGIVEVPTALSDEFSVEVTPSGPGF